MEAIKVEEVFETFLARIRTLPSEDHSESKIAGSVTHQYKAVNVLDYSGSKQGPSAEESGELTIEVEFANLIDMSNVEIKEVTIIGKANIVDFSGSVIDILDIGGLKAVHADQSEGEIGETIR